MAETFHDLPLYDPAIADALFADTSDSGSVEMQRDIWKSVSESLGPDLESLNALSGRELTAALHRIRGYCSTTALKRLGGLLHEWEHGPYPEAATSAMLPLAKAIAADSLQQIESRYPHLRSSA